MENILTYIKENKEWIFSGIGISLFGLFKLIYNSNSKSSKISSNQNKIINTVNVNTNDSTTKRKPNNKKYFKTVAEAKNNISILFIDDDTKFKMINILKRAGWKNTKIIKDINNLHSNDIENTDIFFVDIQGVGKKLAFSDEGLGLANALKNEYPDKKVVIYSAENRGDRFHEALRKADDSLPKNADPYEFEQVIENFFVKD